jgi:hypothetical protein
VVKVMKTIQHPVMTTFESCSWIKEPQSIFDPFNPSTSSELNWTTIDLDDKTESDDER